MLLGERQAAIYRRMGPMSRPPIRSGQWSQTTTGISQLADRLSTFIHRLEANATLHSASTHLPSIHRS